MPISTKVSLPLFAAIFAAAIVGISTPSSASLSSGSFKAEELEPTSPAAPLGSPTAAPPTSAADCKAMAADVTADAPPGDATTPAPGGAASDRAAAIGDIVKRKRPAFRCCFDIWAGKIPEARLYTKVAYTIKLDPAGKVTSTSAKPETDGPAVATDVGTCLESVGASLTYPPSPSQKETTYTHHFDFKPRSHH